MANLSLYSTTAVFLIDSDGNRLLAKYFSPPHGHAFVNAPNTAITTAPTKNGVNNSNSNATKKPSSSTGEPLKSTTASSTGGVFRTLKEQRAFEQGVWEKTRKASGDIILYQGYLILYKQSIDLTFYVAGPETENEIMLQGLLTSFYDSISLLLRHQIEKRAILENLDLVILCLDEVVDDGIVLETDPVLISSRVSKPRLDVGMTLADLDINGNTIATVLHSIREKATQRILAGSL